MDMIIVYMMNGWNGQEIEWIYDYCLYDEWMEWVGNREERVMPSLRGKISPFCP
jgi:hypothetical protein